MAAKGAVFSWNPNLQEEFEATKRDTESLDFLSPYNPEKDLYISTDGSKEGLCYVLWQKNEEAKEGREKKRSTIQLGATGLTPA